MVDTIKRLRTELAIDRATNVEMFALLANLRTELREALNRAELATTELRNMEGRHP